MKPTAAKIDNDTASWSLSWHPEGRCDSFSQEAIRTNAPAASGVYGLFNFNCQLFIGESANIREALLRHERETDFQSAHLRPTGFTFEPCAAELCKPKVEELIAKFRPVMQSQAALDESHSPFVGVGMGETVGHHQGLRNHTDQDFPPHDDEQRPKVSRRLDFKRTWVTTLAATSLAAAVSVFYFGMPAQMHDLISRAGELIVPGNVSKHPAPSGAAELALKPQIPSSIESDSAAANPNREIAPVKAHLDDSRANSNGAVLLAAKHDSAADKAEVKKPPVPGKESTPSSAHSTLSKKWSVQISAAPAKNTADTLVQQLNAKGYASYAVQAEVKGQTFYRVRVGHFDAREQAEEVRQTLARQEGYQNAYLTRE